MDVVGVVVVEGIQVFVVVDCCYVGVEVCFFVVDMGVVYVFGGVWQYEVVVFVVGQVGVEVGVQLGVIGVYQQVVLVGWQEGELLLLIEFGVVDGGFVVVDYLGYFIVWVGWVVVVECVDDVVVD